MPAKHPPLTRRGFLKLCGLSSAGILLAACEARNTGAPVPTAPTPTIPAAPAIPTPTLPGGTMTASPTYEKLPLAMQRGVDKNGWRILGPGGGGAIYIPTIKPDDPDTALIACDMTGSYITHNGGQAWRELNFKAVVRAFAFDPSCPDTLYAGATGLYRSEDTGRTWRLVFPAPQAVLAEKNIGDHADHAYVSSDNWPGGKIQAIAVDPADSRKIHLGVNNGALLLFGSDDFGASWEQIAQLDGSQILKSYLDPASPADDRRIYYLTDTGLFAFSTAANAPERLPLPVAGQPSDLGLGLDTATGRSVLFVASPAQWEGDSFSSGAYRSLDGGQTWEPLKTGLDADLSRSQSRNLNRLAVCPTDARVVYLSAVEPSDEDSQVDFFGIFKSEDMGQTWNWSLRIGHEQPANRVLGWVERDFNTCWGGAPFFMAVAPSTPEVCYAVDWGTAYRTVNGGQDWGELYCETFPDGSVSTRGLDVTNIYRVAFDPFDPAHISLVCTDIGVFHSTNGGRSWSHAQKGVPPQLTNTCYQVLFDPQVKGKAWGAWSNCHDLPRPKMFKQGGVGHYSGIITRSQDGLASWEPVRNFPSRGGVPTDIVLDPRSPAGKRTLYTAVMGRGVYKSIDDGQTWTAKNTGISGSLYAWRLVMRPDGSLYLLVCRSLQGAQPVDGALYHSTDGAENWQPVPLPAGVNFPNDLCFDHSQPDRLYLAAWPAPLDGVEKGGGLWRTEDDGQTWMNIYDESSHVYGVCLDPRDPATVFCTNFEGQILRSRKRGADWERLRGYNFKWAKTPIPDPYNPGMLYLTTFGSSVWYGPMDGTSVEVEDVYPIK